MPLAVFRELGPLLVVRPLSGLLEFLAVQVVGDDPLAVEPVLDLAAVGDDPTGVPLADGLERLPSGTDWAPFWMTVTTHSHYLA